MEGLYTLEKHVSGFQPSYFCGAGTWACSPGYYVAGRWPFGEAWGGAEAGGDAARGEGTLVEIRGRSTGHRDAAGGGARDAGGGVVTAPS